MACRVVEALWPVGRLPQRWLRAEDHEPASLVESEGRGRRRRPFVTRGRGEWGPERNRSPAIHSPRCCIRRRSLLQRKRKHSATEMMLIPRKKMSPYAWVLSHFGRFSPGDAITSLCLCLCLCLSLSLSLSLNLRLALTCVPPSVHQGYLNLAGEEGGVQREDNMGDGRKKKKKTGGTGNERANGGFFKCLYGRMHARSSPRVGG
ncbi:hypothetical protein CTA1_6246 [Colletotrichum tanaceti]|uniref:Uncharacterized protein n=1 Tax=Colletotrichum tanaceti TaxID=1306861 RepID=A0A4U6WYB4_9PEZI|nr:hypothetical protein CTA1_6246 [Colletotrichum tanaceti]